MNETIPVVSPASSPVAPPLPKEGFIKLSPLNRRRLQNFKANRRGYWSFWIFMVLFVLSLFAELIANDKPILASYKGELLYPAFVDYPEEKFGGFLAQTDYRDPVIAKEIQDNGWLLWAPVRFSYTTHNLDLPVPAPAPPTWMLTDEQCRPIAERTGGTGCNDIEWNWLGTDDQGRDVVARLIYGFRISVLFGLTLAGISSIIGVLAGALLRRLDRSAVPALHRDLDRDPVALPAHHHLGRDHAELLRAAWHPAALLLGVAGRRGACRVPARQKL
jgi:microcin C transport system permease protein